MQDGSNDFLTRAVGYAVGFVGVGGLLGYLQYRLNARRAPADMRVAEGQADVHRATAEEIRAKSRREDEDAIVANLRVVTQDLRADIERLKLDREHWRGRAEAAEERIGQLLAEQKERHKLVNELSAYRLRWELLEAGVPLAEVAGKVIEPIYPEAEGRPGSNDGAAEG
jgi:hypothetical protein